jgi:hypothetical protein
MERKKLMSGKRPDGKGSTSPIIPNAETIEVIQSVRRGEVTRVRSVEELFVALNQDCEDQANI